MSGSRARDAIATLLVVQVNAPKETRLILRSPSCAIDPQTAKDYVPDQQTVSLTRQKGTLIMVRRVSGPIRLGFSLLAVLATACAANSSSLLAEGSSPERLTFGRGTYIDLDHEGEYRWESNVSTSMRGTSPDSLSASIRVVDGEALIRDMNVEPVATADGRRLVVTFTATDLSGNPRLLLIGIEAAWNVNDDA